MEDRKRGSGCISYRRSFLRDFLLGRAERIRELSIWNIPDCFSVRHII